MLNKQEVRVARKKPRDDMTKKNQTQNETLPLLDYTITSLFMTFNINKKN